MSSENREWSERAGGLDIDLSMFGGGAKDLLDDYGENVYSAVEDEFRNMVVDITGEGKQHVAMDDGIEQEFFGEEERPEWTCAYCGMQSPASVVKCVGTGKWFCNGRSVNNASCIVTHLVKSGRKEVVLHKQSPLGETVLECYATGNKNVFSLGFVALPDENTVVLLGRDIPASHPAIKDLNVDMSQWQPLIQDRAFVDWLVKHPSAEELRKCKRLRIEEASRLEDMWKNGQGEATLDDLAWYGNLEEECLPVALHYGDAGMYESVFGSLIHLEAEYEKMVKESQVRHNVQVKWDTALNMRHLAKFSFPNDGADSKVMVGDELRLKHPCPSLGSPPWEGVGTVIRLDKATEEIHLEIHPAGTTRSHNRRSKNRSKNMKSSEPQEPSSKGPPVHVNGGYSVEFVWRGVSYERMQNALRSFVADDTSVSGYIYHSILGHTVPTPSVKSTMPKRLSAPGLPPLNHSQMHAVKRVLSEPLSLIQGPPGTGKTVTSATIVYHLAKQGKGQVLVTAPSNIAVDHLAERISLTGLRVVRMLSKTREEVGSSVENLTLQYQIQNLDIPAAAELRKLQLLRNELDELAPHDEKKYRYILRTLEKKVLSAADVICVTCVGAGDSRLANFSFRRVLIDEATQAVEPEALIPLVMGCKQAVLVGDHCQLGPVIVNKKAADAGLCQSLFERLMLLGIKPIRLAVQYRMHPALSAFPSNMFYEGALQNGVSAAERIHSVSLPWPNPDTPLMFWSQLGAEEISSSGTSYLNRTEATAVEKLVTHLLRNGIRPGQIGIITPYEGQRAHVVSLMTRNGTLSQNLYDEIEVASVDSFQGREKDYIILSCVRSNEHQGIGFLSDPRRLNVALTRARFGLVILGNPKVLSKQMIWSALAYHFKEEDALVEGSLKALKPSTVSLGRQRKFAMVGIGPTGMSKFRPVTNAGERFEDLDRNFEGEQKKRRAHVFSRDPFSIGDFPALETRSREITDPNHPVSPTASQENHFF